MKHYREPEPYSVVLRNNAIAYAKMRTALMNPNTKAQGWEYEFISSRQHERNTTDKFSNDRLYPTAND